ncbi:MAG: septum formation initiator family protein [Pseudomonadota bacterium]
MSRSRSPSHAIANTLYSFAILGLISYFSFSAVQGEFGLVRLLELRAHEARLTDELALRRAARAELANRVTRLSDGYLDLDLLDEQAREVLGLARPDEIIIR